MKKFVIFLCSLCLCCNTFCTNVTDTISKKDTAQTQNTKVGTDSKGTVCNTTDTILDIKTPAIGKNDMVQTPNTKVVTGEISQKETFFDSLFNIMKGDDWIQKVFIILMFILIVAICIVVFLILKEKYGWKFSDTTNQDTRGEKQDGEISCEGNLSDEKTGEDKKETNADNEQGKNVNKNSQDASSDVGTKTEKPDADNKLSQDTNEKIKNNEVEDKKKGNDEGINSNKKDVSLESRLKSIEIEKQGLEKENKNLENEKNELDRKLKRKDEEIKTKDHQLEGKIKEIKNLNEKIKDIQNDANDRISKARKEEKENYEKKINELAKGKKDAENKKAEAEKKLRVTEDELKNTKEESKNRKIKIEQLEVSQKQYTDIITIVPKAKKYAESVMKLVDFQKEIISFTNTMLVDNNIDDKYYLYKALARYTKKNSPVNQLQFYADVKMISEYGFVIKSPLSSINENANEYFVSEKQYFFNNYLIYYCDALTVLVESLIGLNRLIENFPSRYIDPTIQYRDKLESITKELEITIETVKLFDKIGSNIDLDVTSVDAGFNYGEIVDIENCIVYLTGGKKPQGEKSKIKVIAQE